MEYLSLPSLRCYLNLHLVQLQRFFFFFESLKIQNKCLQGPNIALSSSHCFQRQIMSPRYPLRRGNSCPEVLSFEKCETAAVASPLINQEHILVNDLFVVSPILTLKACKIWNPLAFIPVIIFPVETHMRVCVMCFFFLSGHRCASTG